MSDAKPVPVQPVPATRPRRPLAQRIYPWFLGCAVFLVAAVVIAMALWAHRQAADLNLSQTQAIVLQRELVQIQGSVTVLVQAEASATATAQAIAAASATAVAAQNDPDLALKQALALVYAAYQQPTQETLQALNSAFSPDAAAFEGNEAQHLIETNTHLGGQSSYSVNIINTATTGQDATLETIEQWEYDEVDASNTRVRCLLENSQQTYSMHHNEGGWTVESISLESSNRSDCPS